MAPASLLSRLYQDLAELHNSPYPGVTVYTDDSNIRQFCLILTPPSGPWKNLSLHFDVRLPDGWPTVPPLVSSSVDIDHPNLFGSYVCCDLLKQRDQIYRGSGYNGGYTPALTLRGLFLQFLTFFSSTKVEQEHGGYWEVGDCTKVWYARRSDLVGRLDPARGGTSQQVPKDLMSDETQKKLRRQFDKVKSESTVVYQKNTEIGPLTQTIKTKPGPNTIHRIEERNHRWISTYKAIRQWQCPRCAYGTDAVPYCVGVADGGARDVDQMSLFVPPPATCKLDILNDDILYEMAVRLPSESVISFSIAYPRLHDIVQSSHLLLERELRCFFLRTGLSESVLGIGVAFNFRARTLSSDFDWLSQRAFTKFSVRESIEKRKFTFFLPLAFSRLHFERALPDIWSRLDLIDRELQRAEAQMNKNTRDRDNGPPKHAEVVGVVYKMMTNIVIVLMKSCDDALTQRLDHPDLSRNTLLYASEKAVVGYCHLFHLMVCLCRSEHSILHDATNRLRRFIDTQDARTKTHVPDLGELIILIMLVVCLPPVDPDKPIRWATLVRPFLEEIIIRNVRWVLKDAPHLEVLEEGPSNYRLAETLFSSKTSLRLVMFQIGFLDLFFDAYGSDLGRLDDNYGFPEAQLPEKMVKEIKEIYTVDNWSAFFERVRHPEAAAFGKDKLSEILRDAVKTSAKRHYHTPLSPQNLSVLRDQRKRVEENSARRK
ncbi:hypothetical protein B0H16DRAFT_1681859 [Mycena metata]|uniref:UBC core domain-containing protein n=1 Tax=Mycena metata TaxID=1033252 RepID=A0AAD7KG27_9AGAR|nr:hypothetical protein B0H16DRAFT_1681859 [Mycena metata]